MPNIAGVLKEEICRLARKEVKTQVDQSRKAANQYRRDIAKLKRQVSQQERELRSLKKKVQSSEQQDQSTETSQDGIRYSARSVKAQRQRLGLSAADYGKLVGVSGLTVYNWEHGKARPRQAQLDALVTVRGIGKREALAKLAELRKAKKSQRRAKR